MKFYVIEIATGDSKIAGKSIYEYESETEAVGAFHSKLGTAMKSELYTSDLICVMSETGEIKKLERFVRPVAVEVEE